MSWYGDSDGDFLSTEQKDGLSESRRPTKSSVLGGWVLVGGLLFLDVTLSLLHTGGF
jgi:hypothetical protein